jgi:hypothetical protein
MNNKCFNEKSKFVCLAAVWLAIIGVSVTASAQTSAANKVINAYIRKEAKSSGAVEYKEARKVIFGDVDGDGDNDAVVQYTLEGFGGGNSFGQMLAVFTNQKGVYKFAAEEVVGGKNAECTSQLKSITKGKILLSTESCPEPPQGICENPKKGKATFVFSKGKLKEL